MRIFDEKFSRYPGRYVLQPALAAVVVLVVLVLLDAINQEAIVASLGATAFIIFALPKTAAARPRVVIPGYMIGVAMGAVCHWIDRPDLTGDPALEHYITMGLGAAAVGLSILLMTLTNSEHAPAAGVALGLVIQQWSDRVVPVVLLGVLVLCLIKALLGRWLKNLV